MSLKRQKQLSYIIIAVGILMISAGMVFQQDGSEELLQKIDFQEINIKNMAASVNMLVQDEDETTETKENPLLTEIKMETAPASVIIPPRVEVYEGMTMEELSEKLNRSLGGILAGHGDIIASHSIEIGVDPFIVAAIMIHETGNGTSNIARSCYNFGGQKGSGCGAYKKYDSVENGLIGIMDNLYRNYYAHGLTTVESIGRRYAESGEWPAKINWYISKLKAA